MSAAFPKGFEHLPRFAAEELFAWHFKKATTDGKDIPHFLDFFDIARIQKAGRLHDLYGRVQFSIGGFEHDRRALHEIPEARTFVRELVAGWPYFFFADALEDEFLSIVVYCLLDNSVLIDRDDAPETFGIQFSPADANRACKPLFDGLVRASGMDSHLNQTLFDARVEAIHRHIHKGVG
jgi:hypothetical protein